jgi:2,4-dienoyl-CoA reductase-like NADH-dependent reductase (Old Yellow Enzyme family)
MAFQAAAPALTPEVDMKADFHCSNPVTMKSPISIGRCQLSNRVVMPAMGVNLSARGGGVSEDIIAFYEARARGGVGLIISEIARVTDGAGAGEPCQLAARGLKDVPDLQRLVDAVHKYGTKFFIQLQHPGMMGSIAVTGEKLVAPSIVVGLEDVLRELRTDECEELVGAFIGGAQVAQMAGADGVELHGAHGYLINQFLSPAINHRSDTYGGSFEGRMRFAVEIIQGITQRSVI